MTGESSKLRLARHICRVTPLGLAPVAPGTAGSLFGLLLALVAWQGGFAVYFAAVTLVVFGGTWAVEVYERSKRTHDDSSIVIDEVAGMMICLAGWERATPAVAATAFILFRILDILKPWPLSWIDKRVGGGVGVMADDIAAAVLCIAALEIIRPFL
jgi:phosphatidylglycerophosphatase A